MAPTLQAMTRMRSRRRCSAGAIDIGSASIDCGCKGGIPNFQTLKCGAAAAAEAKNAVGGSELFNFIVMPLAPGMAVAAGNLQAVRSELHDDVAASARDAIEIGPGAGIHSVQSFVCTQHQ